MNDGICLFLLLIFVMENESPNSELGILKENLHFSALNAAELDSLLHLFSRQKFLPEDIIVREGERSEKFFIIAQGEAEVTTLQNNKSVLLAKLMPGETIGFVDITTNENRLCNATVKALTEMNVLWIENEKFRDFLHSHSSLNQSIKKSFENIEAANFIKKLSPFNNIPLEKFKPLVSRLEKFSFPSGAKIITQGETGEYCYFLLSGKTNVVITLPDGKEKILEVLEKDAIFGEAALLTNMPRNATVIAVENCEVLAASRETLLDLIAGNVEAETAMTQVMMARNRPIQIEGIESFKRQTHDHEEVYVLRNNNRNTYFQLSKPAFALWKQLDGEHTFRDLVCYLMEEYQIFDPSFVARILLQLEQEGFVSMQKYESAQKKQYPLWIDAMNKIQQLMEIKYSFKNVDAFLTASYNKWAKYFYSAPALLTMSLLIFFGIAEFIWMTPAAMKTLHSTELSWTLLILVSLFNLFPIAAHELAHAFTAKYFGYKVHAFGVGWYWLGPIAFCNTSDTWLASNRQRMIVDSAGIYIDLVISGIFALLALIISIPLFSAFIWLVLAFRYLNIIVNLDPMIELDGYYILSDYLSRPNLRENAVVWIADLIQRKKRMGELKKHFPELIYWCCFIAFLVLIVNITLFFQTQVIANLIPQYRNLIDSPYIRWALMGIIILLSLASVLSKVRRKIN